MNRIDLALTYCFSISLRNIIFYPIYSPSYFVVYFINNNIIILISYQDKKKYNFEVFCDNYDEDIL